MHAHVNLMEKFLVRCGHASQEEVLKFNRASFIAFQCFVRPAVFLYSLCTPPWRFVLRSYNTGYAVRFGSI